MKWAALVPAAERPEILNKPHTDWPWPFKGVTRAVSAFLGAAPDSSRHLVLFGTWTWPAPIPPRGYWVLRLWPWPYFAWQTEDGWLIREGFRWDDLDDYYTLGGTIKQEAIGA